MNVKTDRMNKYIFILGMTAMALFAACSTDEGLDAEEMARLEKEREAAILAEAISDSEIPITIGTGTHSNYNVTRAPLNPDANGLFATETGKYLGVFCLAVGKQTSAPTTISALSSIDWTITSEYKDLIVKMRNVPARVTNMGTYSDVTFLNETALAGGTETAETWFYPMNDWVRYNFYAYYPRQNETEGGNTTLQISANQVLEKYYEIDGSQDIIWAMASSNDQTFSDALPYCAKYFRKKKTEIEQSADPTSDNIANYYPQFNFEHKLSQFVFNVKAASTDDAAVLYAKNLKIKRVYIEKVLYRLSLTVAQKSDPTKNGQLKMMGNNAQYKAFDIRLADSDKKRFDQNGDDDLDNPLMISESATETTQKTMGYLMVPPTDIMTAANSADYKLIVEVEYDKDGGTTSEQLQYFLTPPSGGFLAGYKYNVNLTFYAPSEIHALATLDAWQNGQDIELD